MTLQYLLNFLDEDCEIVLEDISGINKVDITKDNPFIEKFSDLIVTDIYSVRLYIKVKGLKGGEVVR